LKASGEHDGNNRQPTAMSRRSAAPVNASVMFLECPAHASDDGRSRCGHPAAVEYRYAAESSGGPVESMKIRCPRGHWFNGSVQSLAEPSRPARG
jgi:hypothetical protein